MLSLGLVGALITRSLGLFGSRVCLGLHFCLRSFTPPLLLSSITAASGPFELFNLAAETLHLLAQVFPRFTQRFELLLQRLPDLALALQVRVRAGGEILGHAPGLILGAL